MSEPSVYFFLCAHIHDQGDDVYLVRSDSPCLDAVDLAVFDPECYELHEETESVVLEPTPSVLDEIVENADTSARSILVDCTLSVPKATEEQRQAYLERFDDGEREIITSRYPA